MIYCPKIQLFNPPATNCAQLFTVSRLCCFPEGSHTVPGWAVQRQSLHNATCQTVSHTYIFKSKCIILHWTYFLLGKVAGLKRQNSSKSLKLKSVPQNHSIHSNSCKPDLLSQVSTQWLQLWQIMSDFSCFFHYSENSNMQKLHVFCKIK